MKPVPVPGTWHPTAVCDAGDGAEPGIREPRRTVALTGFGLLEDGTRFALTVTELSYDGCKVSAAIGLLPGLKFKIVLPGLTASIDADVRWCRDGRAGVLFIHEDVEEKAETPRKYERVKLAATLSLRRAGRHAYQARVFDLSPNGCRVEFIEVPRAGDIIWAKLKDVDALEARVRWVDGHYGGLEFARPIHAAIFDALIARLQ